MACTLAALELLRGHLGGKACASVCRLGTHARRVPIGIHNLRGCLHRHSRRNCRVLRVGALRNRWRSRRFGRSVGLLLLCLALQLRCLCRAFLIQTLRVLSLLALLRTQPIDVLSLGALAVVPILYDGLMLRTLRLQERVSSASPSRRNLDGSHASECVCVCECA